MTLSSHALQRVWVQSIKSTFHQLPVLSLLCHQVRSTEPLIFIQSSKDQIIDIEERGGDATIEALSSVDKMTPAEGAWVIHPFLVRLFTRILLQWRLVSLMNLLRCDRL